MEKLLSMENVQVVDPVGYADMVQLISNCKVILTDSGGLSKESSFGGVKCLFMLNLLSWPELTDIGWIKYIDFDNRENVDCSIIFIDDSVKVKQEDAPHFYGNGNSSIKIVDILEKEKLL